MSIWNKATQILPSAKPIAVQSKNGKCHPPKKRTTIISDAAATLAYSAKKNIPNRIEEYSVLYPATNSCSASGKSKGVLLFSASDAIKNIKKPTG